MIQSFVIFFSEFLEAFRGLNDVDLQKIPCEDTLVSPQLSASAHFFADARSKIHLISVFFWECIEIFSLPEKKMLIVSKLWCFGIKMVAEWLCPLNFIWMKYCQQIPSNKFGHLNSWHKTSTRKFGKSEQL